MEDRDKILQLVQFTKLEKLLSLNDGLCLPKSRQVLILSHC